MRKSDWTIVGATVALAAAVSLAPLAWAGDFNFGLGANDHASAKDVGLPFYPGARLHKEKKGDNSAAQVWGALGAFGLKVVAVELDTPDAPGKVAPFYHNALGRYGQVLDCSPGQPRPPVAVKKSNRLDCHDDQVSAGGFLFKAGVKNEFHLAGVEPLGRGSKIALVYIQMRGLD